MGVGGQPELLERLGDVFGAGASELDAEAVLLTAAIDALVASGSDGIGVLGDPAAVLRAASVSLRSLAAHSFSDARQLRAADTGTLAPVRRATAKKLTTTAPLTAPALPLLYAPKPVRVNLQHAGNWAGIDPAAITQGRQVAERVRTGTGIARDLSDNDMAALAGWLWLRQHTYDPAGRAETNDVNDVYQQLTLHDQARLGSMFVLFDTNAYLRVKDLRSVRTEEFMEWLASPDAKRLGQTDLARVAKERFGISNPEVLDATLTYIGYQLRGAYLVTHPMMRPDLFVIHGWASPVVDVQPWAQSYLATTRLKANESSVVMTTEAMQAIGQLLRGQSPKPGNEDLVRFDMLTTSVGAGEIDPKLVAVIIVGLAVGGLFVAATGGAAATATPLLAKALIGIGVPEMVAGFAAAMIVTGFVEAGASVFAGLATRVTEALLGERDWDTVVDPNMVARDAIIGGLMGLAGGGITHALKQAASRVGKATRSARKAQKALEAAKQVKRSDPAWELELEQLTKQLATARQELRDAKAEQQLLDDIRYRLARQLQNETGAVTPGSWWRKLTGQTATLTHTEHKAMTQRIIALLKKGNHAPLDELQIAFAKNLPIELIEDELITVYDALESGMIDRESIVEHIVRLANAHDDRGFQELGAELRAAMASTSDPNRNPTVLILLRVKGKVILDGKLVDFSSLGDADVVAVLLDGTIQVTEAKNTFRALAAKFYSKAGAETQYDRLVKWKKANKGSKLVFHVDRPEKWKDLFRALGPNDPLSPLDKIIEANADLRVGSKYLTSKQLKALRTAITRVEGRPETYGIIKRYEKLSFEDLLTQLGIT